MVGVGISSTRAISKPPNRMTTSSALAAQAAREPWCQNKYTHNAIHNNRCRRYKLYAWRACAYIGGRRHPPLRPSHMQQTAAQAMSCTVHVYTTNKLSVSHAPPVSMSDRRSNKQRVGSGRAQTLPYCTRACGKPTFPLGLSGPQTLLSLQNRASSATKKDTAPSMHSDSIMLRFRQWHHARLRSHVST